MINSSQSVIPLFYKQIRDGGPVTLTDEQMTRFFLTYDDIEHLILTAIEKMQGGEVFVHKMPAIRIEALAEAMIDVYAPKYDYDPSTVEVEIIGKRVGETLHEEIMTERETHRTSENESLYVIEPETTGDSGEYFDYDGIEGFDPAHQINRSSETAEKLTQREIRDLLAENETLEVVS